MKGLPSRVVKTLTTGAILNCDDNSGAKVVMIIGVKGYKAKKNRYPRAGVGDIVICSVKKGKPEMKKKKVKAVIIRQRKEYRRSNGMRIGFEDNACALIDDSGLPVGTEIKGVIARECAERFPKVGSIAAGIV
ncbi:MAG: 50S ribosomal protein L14 [Candidatus Anstonellales archaeon]